MYVRSCIILIIYINMLEYMCVYVSMLIGFMSKFVFVFKLRVNIYILLVNGGVFWEEIS